MPGWQAHEIRFPLVFAGSAGPTLRRYTIAPLVIPELMGVCEAVLLTSLQEGFGLPYLEATAARRPLVARALPNIAPDLRRFGLRFPQSSSDILVHPSLFDWEAEFIQAKLAADQLYPLLWDRMPEPMR